MKPLLLLSFLLLPLLSEAQNAYWDALHLRQQIRNGKIKLRTVSPIKIINSLSKHTDKDFETNKELYEHFKTNPFITKYLELADGGNSMPKGEDRDREGDDLGNFGFGTLGGMNSGGKTFPLTPTALLAGTADFVVKRTKQELGIALFADFKKAIEKSEILRALLPATSATLQRIDEEIYHFDAYTKTLKEQFHLDLDQLPQNLAFYARTTPYIKDEMTRVYLEDAFMLSGMMIQNRPTTQIVRYLGREAALQYQPSTDAPLENFKTGLRTLALVSESLEYKDSTRQWIDLSEFSALLRDTILTDLYLGLLLEETQKTQFNDSRMSQKIRSLAASAPQKMEFISALRMLVVRTQNLQAASASLEQPTEPSVPSLAKKSTDKTGKMGSNPAPPTRAMTFYKISEATLDLLHEGYSLTSRLAGLSAADSLAGEYIRLMRTVNKLALDVHTQQYASAILNAYQLLEQVLQKIDGTDCYCKQLLRYGTFMATMVQAQDAEAVSKAIEAFALPVGSSSIKKNEPFSISINAHVGIAGGMEYLEGAPAAPFYALTTPIGASFNFGMRKGGSLSLQVSLLDIGALTAFRFQDSSANNFPELKLSNVFAPGGYLVYGLPKMPISIGFGAQVGPQLRNITTGGGLYTPASGWRMGAFLAVDLPIFNVYTSSRRHRACKPKGKTK